MRALDRTLAALQHLLPHHALSAAMYRLMRIRTRWIKNFQIRAIARLVGVDWSEAATSDPDHYPHFNAFFTRELKPGARPVDRSEGTVVSPADGRVSALGHLDGDRLLQAKGQDYSLHRLLADDPACASLRGGAFLTVYLSPRDYHRVHMPLAGALLRTVHVPGRLFSVAPYTVREIPRLFARNERLVCMFETAVGPMAVVLVGAMLVSGIETVWAGEVCPPRALSVTREDHVLGAPEFEQGEELGRFNMGSTVIVVLPPGAAQWRPELHAGQALRMGQRLGLLEPFASAAWGERRT